jgi:hypothetical protein
MLSTSCSTFAISVDNLSVKRRLIEVKYTHTFNVSKSPSSVQFHCTVNTFKAFLDYMCSTDSILEYSTVYHTDCIGAVGVL